MSKKKIEELERALADLGMTTLKLYYALQFYSSPDTYFAVGFFPDKPCGEIMDDFSETELGMKPGNLARRTLDSVDERMLTISHIVDPLIAKYLPAPEPITLEIGQTVAFNEKVYSAPYYPYYEKYKDQDFVVADIVDDDLVELQCISSDEIDVDGLIYIEDLVIKS